MTKQESQEKREQWIIDYLYGELDAEQKQVFERTLESDVELKRLVDEHTLVDKLIPKGVQPQIESERMQGVRWASFRALRAQGMPPLWQKVRGFWQMQVSMKTQAFAMALMFGLGFFISEGFDVGIHNKAEMSRPDNQDLAISNSEDKLSGPLSFIKRRDYQIVDLSLSAYDENKGDVEFSFGLASLSKVKGNLNNPEIRNVLLQTLNTESQDEVRLQLTRLFGSYVNAEDVRQSLIDTLINDPNPGVRYHAVESLVKIADQPDVRMALLKALAHDVNPGIRVEAFLAASEKVDQDLLLVLKNFSVNDANTFIRERSKKMIKDSDDLQQPNYSGVRSIPL